MRAVMWHGIVPHGSPVPEDVPPHERCTAGALVGLLSEAPGALFDDPDGAATIDAGIAHDGLLSAYARVGPVLPIRFGALFSGAAAVRARLAAERESFAQALTRLGMAREYGLSLVRHGGTEGTARPPGPGDGNERGFLRQRSIARRARQDRAARLSAFLEGVEVRLADHAVEVRRTARARQDRLADIAVLVPPEREPAFLRLARTLDADAARHGLRLRLGGPWPAYSFCSEATHG